MTSSVADESDKEGKRFGGRFYMRVSHFSHVQLFVAPQTVAHQAPLSMEFPRQEY